MGDERNSGRFRSNWQDFARLPHTSDLLASERTEAHRWFMRPYISLIVPVDDVAVQNRLLEWQYALRKWLLYEPQPAERLHVSLHELGALSTGTRIWTSTTWQRGALAQLAQRVHPVVEGTLAFRVYVGPLNAFSGALFAEVQDPQGCLHRLRTRVRRALPPRARPPAPWRYLPHITLGYWGDQPVPPLVDALRVFREVEPVPLKVSRVLFTIYARATIPLAGDILRRAHEEIIAEYHLKD